MSWSLYMLIVWFILVFLVNGLFINALQLLVLPLFWLHRHSYHIIIDKLCYCVYSQLTFLAEWWGNFDMKVYGESADVISMGNESSIILINHFSDIDWLAAYVFSERSNCLARTKCIMRNFVKYVPVMGWSWWFAEYSFISRNWSQDKSCLSKTIDGFRRSKLPYMISLFCEGTRRTSEKLKVSQEFAKEKNIQPLKYHLIPRTKGFAVLSHGLKQYIPAIYDVEMAFVNPEQCTIGTLLARGSVEVHIYIRRIHMSEVSCETDEEASAFIMDLYRGKDEVMEYFEKHSNFPAPLFHLPRKSKNLATFIMSNLFVGGLLTTVVKRFVYDTYGLASLFIFLLFICVCMALLTLLLIRLTKTSHGSSFGLKKEKTEKRE